MAGTFLLYAFEVKRHSSLCTKTKILAVAIITKHMQCLVLINLDLVPFAIVVIKFEILRRFIGNEQAQTLFYSLKDNNGQC